MKYACVVSAKKGKPPRRSGNLRQTWISKAFWIGVVGVPIEASDSQRSSSVQWHGTGQTAAVDDGERPVAKGLGAVLVQMHVREQTFERRLDEGDRVTASEAALGDCPCRDQSQRRILLEKDQPWEGEHARASVVPRFRSYSTMWSGRVRVAFCSRADLLIETELRSQVRT